MMLGVICTFFTRTIPTTIICLISLQSNLFSTRMKNIVTFTFGANINLVYFLFHLCGVGHFSCQDNLFLYECILLRSSWSCAQFRNENIPKYRDRIRIFFPLGLIFFLLPLCSLLLFPSAHAVAHLTFTSSIVRVTIFFN